MCNLYSMTSAQAAIAQLFRVGLDRTGNLPPNPGIFPDYPAPVVRSTATERESIMMSWGMPGPPQFGGAPVTIRNTASPHWRRWLRPESRCLVPMTSFCEYADTKPKKMPKWFALDESRPLIAFAGIWTHWTIVPKWQDQTVYLVLDDFGRQGRAWRETDTERTDLESVISDLMAGQYRNPVAVAAFNLGERWANDVSEDIAHEIMRRMGPAFNDLPPSIEDFLDRHAAPDPQLSLRLAQ